MPRVKSASTGTKKKKSKQKSTVPESAEEYLAVGVNFEEAGEKWREGDATKILTSIVDELDELDKSAHPLLILEQALSLFQKCLQLQEQSAQKFHEQTLAMNAEESMDVDSSIPSGSTVNTSSNKDLQNSTLQEEKWATVIEPVTSDTILDTTLVSIECLTTYCQLISPEDPNEIVKVQKYVQYFNSKFNLDLICADRVTEARLTQASFICAYSTAQFSCSQINLVTYTQVINDAYLNIDLSSNPRGLCECAESLVAYNNSIRLHSSGNTYDSLNNRWKALTKAQDCLSTASGDLKAKNIERIYLARGDIDLLRYQLGQYGIDFKSATENSAILLRNAEKFFRGSSALAKNSGIETIILEASLKEALASGLAGNENGLRDKIVQHQEGKSILEEAIEDGLVTSSQLQKLGI